MEHAGVPEKSGAARQVDPIKLVAGVANPFQESSGHVSRVSRLSVILVMVAATDPPDNDSKVL